jgi:hypothetical protein
MTDAQLMQNLESIVSKQDPTTIYTKLKNVGQGASGSVYLAKNMTSGNTVVYILVILLARQSRK